MKIGIVTDETDGPPVGMGYTILNFVDTILKLDTKNDYYLIHRKKEEYDIYKKAHEIIVPYNYKVPFSTIRNFITMPYALKKEKFDIVHHPCNIGPFVFKSILPGKKNVQTIHDIIPIVVPEAYEKSVKFSYKYLLPKIIKNTDIIVTDSSNSKEDIMKYYKVKDEKIAVNYVAHNERFKVMKKEECKEMVKREFNIHFPYILYVGSLEPKKNVSFLVEAFAEFKKKNMPHKLILVGKKGWYYHDIFAAIKKFNLEKEVLLLGYVKPVYYSDELPCLYNCADLFVFPSLYEGFGIPPIEAMACGCPVITSNRGSLAEVVGKGGVLLEKFSTKEYAEAMYDTITNKREREELIRKGLKNSERFSWNKHAENLLTIYESINPK
jgi:glycosyltransferase involved in cell wall biosynthesis